MTVLGYPMFCVYSYRSYDEQNKLYQIGRSVPGEKITYAKAGYSWHNFGLACDLAFSGVKDPWASNLPWDIFGQIVEENRCIWGGKFKNIRDAGHIQKTYGFTLADMRRFWNLGNLGLVWDEIEKKRNKMEKLKCGIQLKT
jgi:peptidoglycan L-alanyl-D-glutamate endopeptidase CwlK